MTLHRLGFFKELPHGNPEGPSLDDRERLPRQQKDQVLAYLRSGAVLATTPTVGLDPLSGVSLPPLQLLTDGAWVWHNDLAHYLQTYDVRLDPSFLRAIAGRSKVGIVDLAKAEDDFLATTAEDSQFFEQAQQIALGYFARLDYDAPVEHRPVQGAHAYRFFQAARGGASIIVDSDGSFLFANSSVPPRRHEAAFAAGERTDPRVFDKPELPTEAENAETLARAQETIAKIAAIPPEQRRTVVNPKFEGPIGNIDAPE